MDSAGSWNYGNEFRASCHLQKSLNNLETVFQEIGLEAHGMWMDRFH